MDIGRPSIQGRRGTPSFEPVFFLDEIKKQTTAIKNGCYKAPKLSNLIMNAVFCLHRGCFRTVE